MDAIRQFRNLMAEVDRLFRVCAIGGFSRGVDRLEVFDNLIEKISNFDVTAIEDELTADASKLKDNLQTARLVLRNAPKSLNRDKLFPEYSELGPIYEKIKKTDGEEWASRVVGGLAGVTSHANGLIADVSKIIDELAKYNDEGEKFDVKQNEPHIPYDEATGQEVHARFDEWLINYVYEECNGTQWVSINKDSFKTMLKSGCLSIKIKSGCKQRVEALLNRLSHKITNEAVKAIWMKNVEKSLNIDRLSRRGKLEGDRSNANSTFNVFLDKIYKIQER